MKKFLILASALALFVITAHAGIGLGSTLSECKQSWGQVLKVRRASNGPNGDIGYDFQSQRYGMEADCFNGKLWRICYTRLDGTPFTNELIKAFLSRTVPGADCEIWVENRGGNKEVFCEVSDGKSRCPSACVIDPAL